MSSRGPRQLARALHLLRGRRSAGHRGGQEHGEEEGGVLEDHVAALKKYRGTDVPGKLCRIQERRIKGGIRGI